MQIKIGKYWFVVVSSFVFVDQSIFLTHFHFHFQMMEKKSRRSGRIGQWIIWTIAWLGSCLTCVSSMGQNMMEAWAGCQIFQAFGKSSPALPILSKQGNKQHSTIRSES